MNRNSGSALPSSKKTHSEKHKQILKQLLREGSNKVCADCKTAVHPRWASWSLGCFVCIRCSGIHRSMGTHISKVKSVDLDAWTDEQVENMLLWGNDKANLYWESKLPKGYVPDPLKIENFIRTKYDMKKWVMQSVIPDPRTLVPGSEPVPSASTAPKVAPKAAPVPVPSPTTKTAALSQANKVGPNSGNSQNLLDDDFGSFTSSPSSTSNSTRKSSPGDSSLSRLSNIEPSVQSAQSTGGSLNISNGRPDLKKSILSLYSSPSSSSSSIPQRQPQQYNTQQATSSNQSINSLSNSLNGLNFSQPSRSQTSQAQPIRQQQTQPIHPSKPSQTQTQTSSQTSQSWNNEWSENKSNGNSWNTPSYTTSTTNPSKLDDDLFKNVWN